MTLEEKIITIVLIALVTALTRFLPFLIFRSGKKTPKLLKFFGDNLPPAVFGMLIVYCLKSVSLTSAPFGLPEFIGVGAVMILQLIFRKMPISIIGGTAIYLMLVNFAF